MRSDDKRVFYLSLFEEEFSKAVPDNVALLKLFLLLLVLPPCKSKKKKNTLKGCRLTDSSMFYQIFDANR